MIIESLCRLHSRGVASAVSGNGAGRSPKKTDTLLEIARRFVSALAEFRVSGREVLGEIAQEEKRKSLKLAYSIISAGQPEASVRSAFALAGIGLKGSTLDPREVEMLISGTKLALRQVHPIAIMRMMTAYIGFSCFEDTEKWLKEKFGTRQASGRNNDELIIPGDLPEVILNGTQSAGEIDLAVRLAGPQLVAAACAGCPREAIERIKSAAYDDLGAIMLEAEIAAARDRLSSDELADTQNAFLELLGSVQTNSADLLADDDRRTETIDPLLVAEVSGLVLELDEKLLRIVSMSLDARTIADLIQAMEPIAHDRLFSCLPGARGKRILDALESAVPLATPELTRKAQIFAQRVLSEIAPKGTSFRKPLTLPAKVRDLLSSILSRE
jgi:hypothetical protein